MTTTNNSTAKQEIKTVQDYKLQHQKLLSSEINGSSGQHTQPMAIAPQTNNKSAKQQSNQSNVQQPIILNLASLPSSLSQSEVQLTKDFYPHNLQSPATSATTFKTYSNSEEVPSVSSLLEKLYTRQTQFEASIKESRQQEAKALREKQEGMEKMITKCFSLMLDKHYGLEQQLQKQIQEMARKVKDLEEKLLFMRVADHKASHTLGSPLSQRVMSGSGTLTNDASNNLSTNLTRRGDDIQSIKNLITNLNYQSWLNNNSHNSSNINDNRTIPLSVLQNGQSPSHDKFPSLKNQINPKNLGSINSNSFKPQAQHKSSSSFVESLTNSIKPANAAYMVKNKENKYQNPNRMLNKSNSQKQIDKVSSIVNQQNTKKHEFGIQQQRINLESRLANKQKKTNFTNYDEELENIVNTDAYNTQDNSNGNMAKYQGRKRKLIGDYHKNVPSKNSANKQTTRPQTSNGNNKVNGMPYNQTEYSIVQQPQLSLIAKTVNKQALAQTKIEQILKNQSPGRFSVSSGSSNDDQRASLKCCKSLMYQANTKEEVSQSPKFIGFINKSETKLNKLHKLVEEDQTDDDCIQFNLDGNNQESLSLKNFNNVAVFLADQDKKSIAKQTSDQNALQQQVTKSDDVFFMPHEFDEKSSLPIRQSQLGSQSARDNQDSQLTTKNTVYQSKNMNLSRFIGNSAKPMQESRKSPGANMMSQNKLSNDKTILLMMKGNRCACIINDSLKQLGEEQANESCGEFCKNLSPQQEREIIKRIIQEQKIKDEQNLSRKRSRSPSAPKQGKQATNNNEDKRYLINAKWWRQWSDYVNFETSSEETNPSDIILNDEKKLSPDEDLDHKFHDLEDERKHVLQKFHQKLKSLKQTTSIYPKPSIISNEQQIFISLFYRSILKPNKNGNGVTTELKEHLVEHFDFIVVSCEVWKHLYSWYSADQIVARFVKRDRTNLKKDKKYLDLYPEKQMYNKFLDHFQDEERESEMFDSESEYDPMGGCKLDSEL